MMRKTFATLLVSSLLSPGAYRAEQNSPPTPRATTAAPSAPQSSTPAAAPETTRPQPPARQRSYHRETRARSLHGISKQEWLFLGAIAGTSMGIGALAAGGKGVAIGAIVGGWAAYAGHRFWKWVK